MKTIIIRPHKRTLHTPHLAEVVAASSLHSVSLFNVVNPLEICSHIVCNNTTITKLELLHCRGVDSDYVPVSTKPHPYNALKEVNMDSLRLNHCIHILPKGVCLLCEFCLTISPEITQHLSKLNKLDIIRPDNSMDMLCKYATNLTSLTLRNCISRKSLLNLSSLVNLTTIAFHSSSVRDRGAMIVVSHPTLVDIELDVALSYKGVVNVVGGLLTRAIRQQRSSNRHNNNIQLKLSYVHGLTEDTQNALSETCTRYGIQLTFCVRQ